MADEAPPLRVLLYPILTVAIMVLLFFSYMLFQLRTL